VNVEDGSEFRSYKGQECEKGGCYMILRSYTAESLANSRSVDSHVHKFVKSAICSRVKKRGSFRFV